jgi:hypothetical protein
LVPDFKFVYGGCMWKSVITASLCDNLHSTFYQHIRSQHSWDVSLVLSNVTSLAEHARQYPGLNGSGQCLLKFVSSLAIFAVSVHGIPVHLSSCRSCPATASMFLRRASHKFLCDFFSPNTTWRLKDANVQNGQVEQMQIQLVCPLLSLTDDWVTLSHSVPLMWYVFRRPTRCSYKQSLFVLLPSHSTCFTHHQEYTNCSYNH